MKCYGMGCPGLSLLYAHASSGAHSYEDGLLVAGDIYAVFDGSTGICPAENAYWLVSRLVKYTAVYDDVLRLWGGRIIPRLISEYRVEHGGIPPRSSAPISTAVVLRTSRGRAEYVVYGDSSLLPVYRSGRVERISDTRIVELERETAERYVRGEISYEEAIKALAEMREKRMCRDYTVVSLYPECTEPYAYGVFSLDDVVGVALASDGFTHLVDMTGDGPGVWERIEEALVETAEKEDPSVLHGLVEWLRRLEDERLGAWQKHDDMTLLFLTPTRPAGDKRF